MAKTSTFKSDREFTATVGERMTGELAKGRDNMGATMFVRGQVRAYASLIGKLPNLGVETDHAAVNFHADSMTDLRTLINLINQAFADLEGSLPTTEG